MKNCYIRMLLLPLILFNFLQCNDNNGVSQNDAAKDYSGVYCLNMQSLEMIIVQSGNTVDFTLSSNILSDGTGTVTDNIINLSAVSQDSAIFSAVLTFSEDGKDFSGPFVLKNSADDILIDGVLLGNKGECPECDISADGIPKFVGVDFTQLNKIEQISKFRSGFGHSYTDDFEDCRSMKHYYNPSAPYRKNNDVEISAPVDGTIISLTNDGHGASTGLTNKQLEIRPDDQPAFSIVLFHVDLLSSAVTIGKKVQAGEKLGYARLYYDDLGEYATSFDIAVWVNTPSGLHLVSYFDTLSDDVFSDYLSRGVLSRTQFIISRAERDNNPLECAGESFVTGGDLENWVILH